MSNQKEVITFKIRKPEADGCAFIQKFSRNFNEHIMSWTMKKIMVAEKKIDATVLAYQDEYNRDGSGKLYRVIRSQQSPAKLLGPNPTVEIVADDNFYNLTISTFQKLELDYQVEIQERKPYSNNETGNNIDLEVDYDEDDDGEVDLHMASRVNISSAEKWFTVVQLQLTDLLEDEYFISLSDVLELLQDKHHLYYRNITQIEVKEEAQEATPA